MAEITIVAGSLDGYSGDFTSGELRFYASYTFTPSDGDPVPAGRVRSANFCKTVPWVKNGEQIDYESFTIDSHTDAIADVNLSTYSLAVFGDDGTYLGTVYQHLRVDSNPSTQTLAQIILFSGAMAVDLPPTYYTAEETDAAIQEALEAGGGGGAWGSITGTLADQTDLNTALNLRAVDSAVVHKTGNESIDGIKTLTSSPIVPVPTTDLQAANKQYVDEFGSRLFVVEFDGSPQSIEFLDFYGNLDTPLGDCMYECWIKQLNASPAGYDWSAGFGGAHGLLRNPQTGNFNRASIITNATNATPIVVTTEEAHGYTTGESLIIRQVEGNTAANSEAAIVTVLSPTTFSIDGSVGNGAYTNGGIAIGPMGSFGSGMVTFGADDFPYAGQWAHSAVGTSEEYTNMAVMYYDGVPVGAISYVGKRICVNTPGNAANGYMGGSDHSNIDARLSQYRIIEGGNYHAGTALDSGLPLTTFRPETAFSGRRGEFDASLLVDFFQPEHIITDKSAGYPQGRSHPGRIRGTSSTVLSQRSSYPGPQFVVDNDVPSVIQGEAPVQPAGKVYVPAAVPVGALVFDSIQRKNSTYAFDGLGGLGSTEGGSLGVLPWLFHASYDVDEEKPFGILNEQFVFLAHTGPAFARVAIAQTNLDIRVSRKVSDSFGAGIATGIMFRYVDDNNYCFVTTHGVGNVAGTRTTQMLLIGKVVAGAASAMTGNATACPASNWEVLRVRTKSDGTYEVFCDATSVVSNTDAQHAAGTGAGICLAGNPAYYGVGQTSAGLRFRARNFTVFANP